MNGLCRFTLVLCLVLSVPAGAATRVPAAPAERTLDAIATGSRLLPVYGDGELVAYLVQSLAPGSLLARMGLRVGDRIVRVDDHPFGAAFTARELFEALERASRLRLEVESPDRSLRLLEIEFTAPAGPGAA
jgi:type II secretory pathway component PulC